MTTRDVEQFPLQKAAPGYDIPGFPFARLTAIACESPAIVVD